MMRMKNERALSTRSVRALHNAGIIATFVAGIGALPHAACAATPLIAGQFIGQAAAIVTQAVVGPLAVGLGSSSSEGCPCQGSNGKTLSDRVLSLSVGAAGTLVKANVNVSTAYGLKTTDVATTTQTTVISGINLLNGLITATSLRASASVTATSSALTPSYAASSFVGLVIAGKKIGSVAENTVIPLPGIGSVTLKFVNTGTYGTQAIGLEVEMLRVSITESNSLGLPVGAVIEVGEAYAGYNRIQPAAALGGYAATLGANVSAGSLLQEAASAGAFAGIGSCSGTNGTPVTAAVANLSVPGLLTIGAATSTASGGPDGKASVAKTESQLSNISLLGGLITANDVTAVAQESRTGVVSTGSALGSSFGNLAIAGVPIASNVAPNTIITLPAIGYIVLNEQPEAASGHIQVNGLHVVITLQNALGLAVGTELFLSHAEASATSF